MMRSLRIFTQSNLIPLSSQNHMSTKTNQSPLFLLRKKTGLAYNLCREALQKFDNDVPRAEAWLNAQALAHGLQKASKVGSRNACEGLIGVAIGRDGNEASVLELNCETDFVAKNEFFKELATNLTRCVANSEIECQEHEVLDTDGLKEIRLQPAMFKQFDGLVMPLISRLGENIKIRRAVRYITRSNDIRIFADAHAVTNTVSDTEQTIKAGRFAAVVGVKLGNENRNVDHLGGLLCRHVIGYNPQYVELPEEVRANLEAIEKEREERLKEEEAASEVIADAREDDIESSISNSRDDWPSMMDQTLLTSDDLTVRQLCDQNNFSIIHFKRFECGQE